ncbi:MAG: hypothetical protein LBG73_06590 [Spirochaetaceae bacterium]|jgi:hypothetical protein|nr:hypothetical protein [Spirochaetaceae bacterium]
MRDNRSPFIGKLLLLLLVIGLSITGCEKPKPSVDKLLDELDSILTEYFTLMKEQEESEFDPAKMARIAKLHQRMETLSEQLDKIDTDSLTEKQLTKLFSTIQKISELE